MIGFITAYPILLLRPSPALLPAFSFPLPLFAYTLLPSDFRVLGPQQPRLYLIPSVTELSYIYDLSNREVPRCFQQTRINPEKFG